MHNPNSSILKAFCNHLIDLYDDLIPVYPKNVELRNGKTWIELTRKVNPKILIRGWFQFFNDASYYQQIKDGDIDWCRTKSVINASIIEVQRLIENKIDYPKIFKRIKKTEIITDEIVYIALDMPFPFSDRDYVVKYINKKEGLDLIYSYYAVIHKNVPIFDEYVRLKNSMGEWRLKIIDIDKTEITYTWNGELLGDFPSFSLGRAWKTGGTEIIEELRQAIENKEK